MGLEDGEVSLLKCLELAMFDGVCALTGNQVGEKTGDAREFDTYEKLIHAYHRQVEYITRQAVSMANKSQQIYSKYAPNPLRSCLIAGCIEKGRDYKSGGPIYGHGQILTEGIADTADSLAAIKHFVFEEKSISMSELLSALSSDFENSPEIYSKLSKYKKFGNDDSYVDKIAGEILEHFFRYLNTLTTFRGGKYSGGCSTFERAPGYGRAVGAMPNGHRRGNPLLADSIGATPGRDIKGPTAALKSVMNYNQRLATSGLVFNIKFEKSLFSSEKGKSSFINLAKTYFNGGGQQMSVNVLSRDELAAAKKNPEKYKNLIVRVGGYSDYFVNLSPDLQDSIIMRTGFEL